MPRRGRRKVAPAPIGRLDEPDGWRDHVGAFLDAKRVKGYTPATVANYQRNLRLFVTWCEERNILRPREVTRPIIERYQRQLYYHRKRDGQALSFRTQHSRLVPVVQLFRWLTRAHHLLANPGSEIELPRFEARLPRAVLTASEAEEVLMQPDVTTLLGLRDRAILETFYSTGMRRMELVSLRLYDVDASGAVTIRQGKGKKDRIVPIGERALRWIDKYVTEVRPQLVVMPDEGVLFLTTAGEPFLLDGMSRLARQHIDAAALPSGKRGSTHLFRHTMATLMLESGADIRFIQAMLGHANLQSTQLYTHVSIKKLKEIYDRTHPAAKLGRREGGGDAGAEIEVDAEPASDRPSYRRGASPSQPSKT